MTTTEKPEKPKKSLLERIWDHILTRIQDFFTDKKLREREAAERANLEAASELPRLKAPLSEKYGVHIRFRYRKIILYGLIISFLNWVFWDALDYAWANSGGFVGISKFLGYQLGFQNITSSFWTLICTNQTSGQYKGQVVCYSGLANLVLLILGGLFVFLALVWAISGFIKAIREDEWVSRQEQRDLIKAAVLEAMTHERAYQDAMRQNEEYRKEDERRKEEERRKKGGSG